MKKPYTLGYFRTRSTEEKKLLEKVYYAGAGWLPGILVYFYSGHDKPASFISLIRVPMGSAGGR